MKKLMQILTLVFWRIADTNNTKFLHKAQQPKWLSFEMEKKMNVINLANKLPKGILGNCCKN